MKFMRCAILSSVFCGSTKLMPNTSYSADVTYTHDDMVSSAPKDRSVPSFDELTKNAHFQEKFELLPEEKKKQILCLYENLSKKFDESMKSFELLADEHADAIKTIKSILGVKKLKLSIQISSADDERESTDLQKHD